jgi:hypothetical protein
MGGQIARTLVSCLAVVSFVCGMAIFCFGDCAGFASSPSWSRSDDFAVVCFGVLAMIFGRALDATLGRGWLSGWFDSSRARRKPM